MLLVPAPAQLLEPGEPVLAGLVVGREAAAVGPRGVAARAELDGDDPGRRARQQLAVVGDEQHGLGRLAQRTPRASACPARRGSCPARRASAPRPARAAAPRAPAASARRRTGCAPRATAPSRTGTPRADDRAGVPEHLGVVAAGVGPVGQRLGVPHLGLLVVALHHRAARPPPAPRPRARTAGGATDTSRSRTDDSSRTEPTNWRITPSPPDRPTEPSCGSMSPATSRSRVVLPAPLAPTSATFAPSPTRKETSRQQAPPVRQVVADAVDVDVAHRSRVCAQHPASPRPV